MRRGKTGSGRKGTAATKPSPAQQKRAFPAGAHMATKTPPSEPATLEEDHFQALMQAITECKTTLTEKIDFLQTDFGLLCRDMDKVRGRLGEAERRVGESEDSIRDHHATLDTLQVRIKALESRAEDSENRSRRNNLRVVGLPEGAEGQDTVAFTEHFLCTLLPGVAFSPHYAVERARRMPPVRGQPGAPPPHVYFSPS